MNIKLLYAWEDKLVPLPINIHTINTIFNKSFESEQEVKSFVDSLRIKNQEIINAQDWLYDKIGERLTNIFTGRIPKNVDLTQY